LCTLPSKTKADLQATRLTQPDMRLFHGTTIAVFGLLISSAPAFSWGRDGHQTVGMVADLLLREAPTIRDTVEQILGGVSLSEASVFADCAKGPSVCQRPLSEDEKDYVDHNHQHHEFHYTDVAIQQSEYRLGAAGTRDDDVVQIIKQTVNILRGRSPNNGPAVLSQKQALWVLAHMVGDIHQPLHVGAAYFDRDCQEMVDPNVVGAGQPNFGIGSSVVSSNGGNDLKLGTGKSFHVFYWDEGVVTGAMRLAKIPDNSIEDFAAFILANPPTGFDTVGDPETWAEQWATEILPLARDAYTRANIGMPTHLGGGRGPMCTWPVSLSWHYTQLANQQALHQLSKAGFRLAAILRAIFGRD
jgi:hypothetical protein